VIGVIRINFKIFQTVYCSAFGPGAIRLSVSFVDKRRLHYCGLQLLSPKPLSVLKYLITNLSYNITWGVLHPVCSFHSDCIRTLEIAECKYEGWNFNSGNYLFTTDTK